MLKEEVFCCEGRSLYRFWCGHCDARFAHGAVNFPAFGRLIDRQIDGWHRRHHRLRHHRRGGHHDPEGAAGRPSPTASTGWRAAIPVIAGTGANDTQSSPGKRPGCGAPGRGRSADRHPLLQQGNPAGPAAALQGHCGFRWHSHHPLQRPLPHRGQHPAGDLCGVGAAPQYRRCQKRPPAISVKSKKPGTSALPDFSIWSGNDDETAAICMLGGAGVISVAADVLPAEMRRLTAPLPRQRLLPRRAKLQLKLKPLCDALFCEVNPIPVKTALNLMGLEAGELRLPLCPPTDASVERLEAGPFVRGICCRSRPPESLFPGKVPLFLRTAALSVSKKSFLPAEPVFRNSIKVF